MERLYFYVIFTVVVSALWTETRAYSQVFQHNQHNDSENIPKVFKSLHTDLSFLNQQIMSTTSSSSVEGRPIYITPINQARKKIQHTTDFSVSNTNRPMSSGRAIYTQSIPSMGPVFTTYQSRTPFVYRINDNSTPNKQVVPTVNIRQYSKLPTKDGIADRFTPAEAVVSNALSKKNKNQERMEYSNRFPNNLQAAPSNNDPAYANAPSDIYAFPPNSNSKYPLPTHDARSVPFANNISSYLPPPSGPLMYNTMSQNISPPENKPIAAATEQMNTLPAIMMSKPNEPDDQIGVLPASAMDTDSESVLEHDHHEHDDDKIYYTPPPGWIDDSPHSGEEHDYHKSPIISYDNALYPTYFNDHDDHDHSPHFSYEEMPHHIQSPSPVPPAPQFRPDPPPQPRVKKYSYFYIGRKLWYIPLYFTVWFSFYVLWLIVKSIARHKVNLPNNYTGTATTVNRNARSIHESASEEFINNLTQQVLHGIEIYKQKYLT